MAAPYKRSFNAGRGSEQLYNEELHKIYESVKHLTEDPGAKKQPVAKLHQSVWHDERNNDLLWYDKPNNKWRKYYENDFRITNQITNILPPSDPIKGQLWLHNGVLMYFDGSNWQPIKALIQDGSQFSLDVFRNFILLSPLHNSGNTVVRDDEIEEFRKEYQKYLQGKVDAPTNSTAYTNQDNSKWDWDWKSDAQDPSIPTFAKESYMQFVVPNTQYMRLFLEDKHDVELYEELSSVAIQYKRKYVMPNTPSVIHLNPGKLSKITKRLFKIDRATPQILVTAQDTEYYGFRKGEIQGHLLIPDNQITGELRDYTIIKDGIHLSYNASQNYDYVLAIHYDFNLMRNTGSMGKVDNNSLTTSYYVNNYHGEINTFVDGFNIEDPYYTADNLAKTVTFEEDVSEREISMFRTPKHEYGYIRKIDINGHAVIRPIRKYRRPLVFVNGLAMHPAEISFESDGTIIIPGAKRDMAWSIVDLYGPEDIANGYVEEYEANIEYGWVADDGLIHYNGVTIEDTDPDSAILFIQGLLVKKDDLIFDRANKTLTVTGGLNPDQPFILVRDKHEWLYSDDDLMPALPTGRITDSLVYLDGYLLSESSCVDEFSPKEYEKFDEMDMPYIVQHDGVFQEVKCFKTITYGPSGNEIVTDDWQIWNSITEEWESLDKISIGEIKSFVYSYENTPQSISLNIPYSKKENRLVVYGFNTNQIVENPLIIGSITATADHPILTVGNGKYWDDYLKKEIDFADPLANRLKKPFLYRKNTLRVWLNGIRQYPYADGKCQGITEFISDGSDVNGDGTAFRLPEPFVGKITYAIEYPELNRSMPCTMEVLDHTNIKKGYSNLYETVNPLFPGRVTVYVNGIRLPEEQIIVLDSHRLIIDNNEPLIGNSNNYPTEKVIANEKQYKLTHKQDDLILVEVRDDNREEFTVTAQGHPVYEFNVHKYDYNIEALDAQDEIMIFVNGLYFGPRLDDGYTINKARESISITDVDTTTVINYDEQAELLLSNQDDNDRYLLRYKDPYIQDNAILTFEWR